VKKPNTIEDEIDRIRLEIYEETKHMTDAEYVAYIRKSAEEGVARYDYKLVPSTKHKGCQMLVKDKGTNFGKVIADYEAGCNFSANRKQEALV